MGVVHSMEEDQVERVSNALRESAEAIQGINRKFDVVDEHWHKMSAHHQQVSARIDETLASFELMENTFSTRIDTVMNVVTYATDELSAAMENMLLMLSRFDLRREATQLPKIIIPLAIPLIVLLIELAVANAYLGILLASLPEVRNHYSRYLLSNASSVLIGLSVSLLWLGGYRLWLSSKSRRLQKMSEAQVSEYLRRQQQHVYGMVHTQDTVLEPSTGKHSTRGDVLDSFDQSEEVTEGKSIFAVPQLAAREKLPQSVMQPGATNRRDFSRQESPYTPERRRSAAAIIQGVWNVLDTSADVSVLNCSADPGGQADRRQKPDGPRFSNVVQKLKENREHRGTSHRERLSNRLAAMGQDMDDQVATLRQRRSTSTVDTKEPTEWSALGSSSGVVRSSRSFARGSSITLVEPENGLQDAFPGRTAGRSSQREKDALTAAATNFPAAEAEGKMRPQIQKDGGLFFNPFDTKVHWSTAKRPTPTRSECLQACHR